MFINIIKENRFYLPLSKSLPQTLLPLWGREDITRWLTMSPSIPLKGKAYSRTYSRTRLQPDLLTSTTVIQEGDSNTFSVSGATAVQ